MKNLPARPNLQYLLREAKVLKSRHRKGDTSICATIGHYDTSLHGLSDADIFDTRFSILDAQRVVARQYGFSSWTRLKKFVHRSVAGVNPLDRTLRDTLLARHKELITLQNDVQHKVGDYKGRYRQYRKLADDSASLLNTAFDSHGWPGPDVIGLDCVGAITFVSGNAVYDAAFQYRSTQLMGEALAHGGFDSYWYAQFVDRYLTLSKNTTIYGSSFGSYYDDRGEFKLLVADVIDPSNLDKRRARVGHEAWEVARLRHAAEARDNNWQLPTRNQAVSRLEKLSVDGGYLSQ